MEFSVHKDNLSMKHLERQERKVVIEKKILQDTKTETTQAYGEVLKTLRPDQIWMLLQKNYFNEKTNQFLPYAQIHKDYAYNFLVQTALTMLWVSTDIDADYWPKTKAAVEAFQRKHWLSPDGQVWPDVLNVFINQLRRETKTPSPIEAKTPAPIEAKTTILKSNKENKISISLFHWILAPYKSIEKEYWVLLKDFSLSEQDSQRLAWIIYNENPTFSKKRRNYTPIGQVWRWAREDGWKEVMGSQKAPAWNKTNTYQQLIACYGYAKKCGIFEAKNPKELWEAYAKYNLWLYHKNNSRSKIRASFRNQAKEMQGYAMESAKKEWKSKIDYENIIDAQYRYYSQWVSV
jgi:hypothetical protein